jgi:hypothetical protein
MITHETGPVGAVIVTLESAEVICVMAVRGCYSSA